MSVAWVNGELVPLARARVSVLDQGFRTGEGVFETMRVYGDHPFRLAAHLDRAAAGAARLAFVPPDRDDLARAILDTVAANAPDLGAGDSVARLTLTPGGLDPDADWPGRPLGVPTVVVTSHRLVLPERLYVDGVTAVTVAGGREHPDVKAVSYLSAILARRQAQVAGADEALLTDAAGNVLEGAASNLFAVHDGVLVTPPVSEGLLAGVTRATAIEVAAASDLEVRQEPLPLARLLAADEAFLTASTREVVPLVRVDGHVVGSGRPGPVTATVLAAYRAAVAAERSGA